jgi:hypothetical protein
MLITLVQAPGDDSGDPAYLICRRVDDCPGHRAPPGLAVALCYLCGAAVVHRRDVYPDRPRVCRPCLAASDAHARVP